VPQVPDLGCGDLQPGGVQQRHDPGAAEEHEDEAEDHRDGHPSRGARGAGHATVKRHGEGQGDDAVRGADLRPALEDHDGSGVGAVRRDDPAHAGIVAGPSMNWLDVIELLDQPPEV
jgi:hypothetical protein